MGETMYSFAMSFIRIYRIILRIIFTIFERPLRYKMVKDLERAGVTVNGDKAHDPKVTNGKVFPVTGYKGLVGLGEAYMDSWWDCERLDEFWTKVLRAGLIKKIMHRGERFAMYFKYDLFGGHTRRRAAESGSKAQEIGDALFQSFLDPHMNYSCGYWKDAKDLTEAQKSKMDLIAKKLQLKAGLRVLDIGCGWGGLAHYLAENYKVRVVGVTTSLDAAMHAKEFCKGLDVEIRLQDYREVDETFDRIVSVELFEQVGPKNHREFFEIAEKNLTKHGLFLLHTMGHDQTAEMPQTEPWLAKYIFPNLWLPNHKDLPKCADNLFTIEDWDNLGAHYDKTIMAWYGNFVKNWPSISSRFEDPDRFFRMWTYYMMFCAACFRSRKIQLWQVVFSKQGFPGGYMSVR